VGFVVAPKGRDPAKPHRFLLVGTSSSGDERPAGSASIRPSNHDEAAVSKWVAAIQDIIGQLKKRRATQSSADTSGALEASSSLPSRSRESAVLVQQRLKALVPLPMIEGLRQTSQQGFIEAHQLWLRSGESVEPKVLLPIAESFESLASSLGMLLKVPALNSDEVASLNEQLSVSLEEGRVLVGRFKAMIQDQFPASRDGSSAPRQAMAAMLKWFLKLEQQCREVLEKTNPS